jgi:hypothetical protein
MYGVSCKEFEGSVRLLLTTEGNKAMWFIVSI